MLLSFYKGLRDPSISKGPERKDVPPLSSCRMEEGPDFLDGIQSRFEVDEPCVVVGLVYVDPVARNADVDKNSVTVERDSIEKFPLVDR